MAGRPMTPQGAREEQIVQEASIRDFLTAHDAYESETLDLVEDLALDLADALPAGTAARAKARRAALAIRELARRDVTENATHRELIEAGRILEPAVVPAMGHWIGVSLVMWGGIALGIKWLF